MQKIASFALPFQPAARMYHTSKKIQTPQTLQHTLAHWRFKQEKIVFTNGCFDILHAGHVDYLEKARALGTVLIVGLNTDASVRRLKTGRPVQDENARARLLASLQFVDAVMLFDEDTPLKLIETVRPNVLVKGKDYAPEQVVGYDFVTDYGGRVETIDLVPGYSTSAIIQKIRQL